MKAIFIVLMVSILFSCQQPEPVISDAEFIAFRKSHPGMVQRCLDEVRYGGYNEWDPECYEMLPAQRWEGLWEHGWEWTNFCPEPARTCNWMAKRGTWLTFADNVVLEEDIPEGIHRIEFVGRRTKVPGNFGHTFASEHLMVVDRIIALEPLDANR